MGTDSLASGRSRVLIVEDDPAAARLLDEALRDLDGTIDTTVATDGEQALRILGQRVEAPELDVPDAVVLDLDLPKLSGQAVLRQIRADPTLSTLPVVICSQHTSQEVVDECYRLRANAYFVKPDNYDDLLDTLREMRRFWDRDDVPVPETDPERD